MLTFLIVLILVFIGVDLLVRFVIDPLASGSTKKNKVSKSYTPRFDPTLKLASETMYDGGELHKEEKPNDSKVADVPKDASSNSEQ
jgi:hypothetical protein